jgi:hypothetical protein
MGLAARKSASGAVTIHTYLKSLDVHISIIYYGAQKKEAS